MKDIANLFLAIIFLINNFAVSSQIIRDMPPQRPAAQGAETATPTPGASFDWNAYPPPVGGTPTSTAEITPSPTLEATPTAEPTPLPSPIPTDTAPIVVSEVKSLQLELSAEPALYIPGKLIQLDWAIDGASQLPSFEKASLVLHLPEGVAPHDKTLDSAITAEKTMVLPLAETDHALLWDISPDIAIPFTIAVDLVLDGAVIDSNAVLFDQAISTVARGNSSVIDLPSGAVSLNIPDGSMDEALAFGIRNPSPNKLPPVSLTGKPVEIIAVATESGKNVTQFLQPIELTIRYDKELIVGGSEADLQLYYYNETDSQWHPLETTVDTANQVLTAKTDHLTVFDYQASSWQGYIPPTVDAFQVSEFTGAGTYAMDFPWLPGPAALKPVLNLTYNSQVIDEGSAFTQASWVGMGWALDTGAITRNMHETNNETNDDSFSISVGGIHGLLLPSGINGAITTYSTADQLYVKVEQDAQANTWKAWAKDGTVYQFGYAAKTSTNSCAENASDLNLTWQWALTTVTDIHGNTLNYSYTPDKKPDPCLNIVAIYPDTIRYANDNYQVKFITELRGDYYENWTDRTSKTLHSTRRLKELLLQNKDDAGNWVTVRKYVFSYASDSEMANVILPNFKWNDNSHTSTLIGVQEQSGDGSASLPATSFYYNADNMHLNKVDNGQGGVVEFAYERVSVFDDANKTRFKIWLFGDTDCNPYHANPDTTWKAKQDSVGCLTTQNPAAGYLYLSGASPIATQSFPQHIVKPGADYRFAISGMSNDPDMGTGTHWGFKNESTGDLIRLGTPPDSQIILNHSPEWTQSEGTLTMPATFDPGKTVLWLANSGSKIQYLQVSLYVTRYRVTSRTLIDGVTGRTDTYPYFYDNFAYNNAAVSQQATSTGPLYTKVMGEFRGHSLAQVTNPAELTTMTWFHQGDDLKGSLYRTLTLKQTYGIDGFASIQANAWTSSPANSSIVDYLYGTDFDTSINTQNDSANWNVTFSRSSANLSDGMAAIAHVRLSEENSQGQVGLVSASGRFFGVLLTSQGGIQQCVDGCSGAQIGSTLVSPADFQKETWYVVILQVDDDDGLRVRTWPLDRPELYSEAAAGGFAPESWRFIQKTYSGQLWLDAYLEGILYSETDTTFAVDIQAQMVSGNDAVINRWPYSMVGGQPQAFTDLYIRWARPVQTSTRTYGVDASQNQGDSRWMGTRQTFDYAPKEQFGNLIHTTDYRWDGSNWAADHARGVAYFPRDDGTRYLVSLPARVIEVACNPDCDFSGANGLLAETLYLYDTNSVYNAPPNGAGRLAKQRTLVDELLGQKRYSETAYSYADSYGNITGVTTYTGFATENSSPAGVGRTTERIYDDKYHAYMVTETNALDQVTTTGYDFNLGLPTRVTDANGALQGAAYDAFARLTAVCAPGDWDGVTCDPDSGPTLSIRYTNYNGQANPKQPFNILLQQKLDDTRTMQSQRYYSGWGELLQSQVLGVLLAEGTRNTVVDYQYDALGRLVRQTQPYAYAGGAAFQAQSFTAAQGTATTTYDILSRVIRITQADGSDQASAYTLAYDPELGWGLQTALTDARDQTTLRLQDAWGRQVRVTPPAGPGVKYAYDALSRLTDAYYGSAHTGLTYNYAGQKVSMADADMGSWSYTYDAPGNLKTQTDARGCVTTLDYDELNRLTGKTYNGLGSCGATSPVTYTYDFGANGIGRRTGMSDPGGGTAWVYDLRGRVEQEVVTISGVGEYVTTWTYNSADLVTGMTYPGGEVVATGYTPQGTVSTVNSSLWDSYVIQTGYDAVERVLERSLGNDGKTAYTYYPWTAQGGRLQNVSSSKLSAPLTTWQDLDYTYDANGNLDSITDAISPETLAFSYDTLNRLTGVSGAYAQSYSYDSLTGNLASKAGQTLAYGDPNHKHAATGIGGNAYSYDANGNMTSRTVDGVNYALGYDAENRLVSINGGGLSATYSYNSDGERVKAAVTVGGIAETTAYVGDYFEVSVGAARQVTVPPPPDCGGVVQCVFLPVIITAMPPIPAGHAWTSTYFAGGSRIAQRVQSNQEGVESGLYYFLTDHLGSTSVTLDASGNKVAEMRYSAWGETRFTSGETPTQRRYTGQLAAEAGLYFYNARFYDSMLGRFLSADSLVPGPYNPLDWDRYSYVRNNPVNYTDPTGHMVSDPIDGAWWDEYTPVYILEHVQDDSEQDQMLVAYMYNHPDYNSGTDQQIIDAEYDPTAMTAILAIERFKAEVMRSQHNDQSVVDLWVTYAAPAVAAGIVLGGQEANNNGTLDDFVLKGRQAVDAAGNLGYTRRIAPQRTPFDSHGQPVFYNPKTKTYITPDVDAHKGGVWKMFDRKGERIGTYDANLNLIAK